MVYFCDATIYYVSGKEQILEFLTLITIIKCAFSCCSSGQRIWRTGRRRTGKTRDSRRTPTLLIYIVVFNFLNLLINYHRHFVWLDDRSHAVLYVVMHIHNTIIVLVLCITEVVNGVNMSSMIAYITLENKLYNSVAITNASIRRHCSIPHAVLLPALVPCVSW